MVDNAEAPPAEIDKALMYGPAPRMVVQEICKAFPCSMRKRGMASNLDQFGPALKLPRTRIETPEHTNELRNKMVKGCLGMTSDKTHAKLIVKRDSFILGILKLH